MKQKEGFRLRKLGREYIVTAEGLKQVNFNKMIVFNETSAYLWNQADGREFTAHDLADWLLQAYDVDSDTARADAEKVARLWVEAGIVEE